MIRRRRPVLVLLLAPPGKTEEEDEDEDGEVGQVWISLPTFSQAFAATGIS